jgi:tetratricopeptide (TPR) repeat protein
VAQAPQFSLGYSGLAVSSAQLLQFSSRDETSGLRADAQIAADRALALDPKNGEAYYALALLTPRRSLSEREALFRKGLAVEPDEPTLNSTLAVLLADEGRLKQAVVLQRRAVMVDPLSPRKTAGLAQMLANAGQVSEARAIIDRATRLWPTSPGVWMARLYILANFGFETEARAMLDAPQAAPVGLEPEFFYCVRAYLDAVTTKTPAARANAKRILLSALASDKIGPTVAIETLARIGELDEAFTLANRVLVLNRDPKADTEILFHPTTAQMRSDQRFRDLMERTGLFAYWSRRNDTPDFCTTEDAPVCQEFKRS